MSNEFNEMYLDAIKIKTLAKRAGKGLDTTRRYLRGDKVWLSTALDMDREMTLLYKQLKAKRDRLRKIHGLTEDDNTL